MASQVETYNKGLEEYGVVSDTTAAGPDRDLEGTATTDSPTAQQDAVVSIGLQTLESKPVHWYSYLKTWDFWVVVLLGQVLSLCITGTNTFSTFLSNEGTNIPAFQSLFNYVLLALVYVPILFYQKGWRYVVHGTLLRDGWKFVCLSFLDVQGNYFTVLAYRYTNILSAQLLNFWSIVCVVIISFVLLHVRYRPFQIAGILVACGGMGLLLASDHITHSNGGPTADKVKGDLFGLLGASLYGISNVFEEWFVSKRPAYEVLACLGFWGVIINGVTAAIFDRHSFAHATWNGKVGGYLTGYTLILFIFYTLAPLILRMGSAAFFDISLLTGNFWGVIIGIHVFGETIHYLYPIAFVLIVIGLFVYFLSGSLLGDARKPWLGTNQEDGVAGWGTAKLKALNEARKQDLEDGETPVAD
ncbi:solute carrier protein [Grosmannia clavigera kw1407]|uniref:Solute carrier protein n=1 Tax=Grosmannia clavigera (strain kw1407 / UAMH 11150) TaxID=655863 RepID=F0XK80_GROCL|nr:solute carrier protein [Grosmannia clavigera kw1407]EFX01902.1 solute carrier protein [Grosmannia clavigera kw1407]